MLVMCFIFHIPKGNLIPRSHSDAKRWGTCLETWVHDSDNFGLKSTVNVPCEQCFLKARHYASMRKKLLRATVCFSIEHARPRDDYEYSTTRRQRELQQNNRFNKHNNNFAFLCHLCTTTKWRCLILRCMDNVNKQRRNLFFFSLLNLNMVPWNSTPFGFCLHLTK